MIRKIVFQVLGERKELEEVGLEIGGKIANEFFHNV